MEEGVGGWQDAVLEVGAGADVDDTSDVVACEAFDGDDDLLDVALFGDLLELGDVAEDGDSADGGAFHAGVFGDEADDVRAQLSVLDHLSCEALGARAGADNERAGRLGGDHAARVQHALADDADEDSQAA